MIGVRCSLFRALAWCAVHWTSEYVAICVVVLWLGGYTGAGHGVGDVDQSAVIVKITFGLTA